MHAAGRLVSAHRGAPRPPPHPPPRPRTVAESRRRRRAAPGKRSRRAPPPPGRPTPLGRGSTVAETRVSRRRGHARARVARTAGVTAAPAWYQRGHLPPAHGRTPAARRRRLVARRPLGAAMPLGRVVCARAAAEAALRLEAARRRSPTRWWPSRAPSRARTSVRAWCTAPPRPSTAARARGAASRQAAPTSTTSWPTARTPPPLLLHAAWALRAATAAAASFTALPPTRT